MRIGNAAAQAADHGGDCRAGEKIEKACMIVRRRAAALPSSRRYRPLAQEAPQ
jgi:hypothetical protein